jgi:sugar phosphate isomerase/epimerase
MPERLALFSSAVLGWDAERVVATAVALGLGAVEWGVGPGQSLAGPRDGPRVAQLCREAGLAVAGLAVQDTGVTVATPRPAAPFVALAAELGAPHVRYWAPVYEGGSPAAAQRRSRAGVDGLVERAAAAGIAVLVENSPGTIAPSVDLALEQVGHQPPARAGVLFDPGNAAVEGQLGTALALARLGRHLRHVHVKNVAWSRRGGVWRWDYADLDRGIVEWPAVVAALAAARYRRWLSIDHLGRRPTPALLRSETERLRQLLLAAG